MGECAGTLLAAALWAANIGLIVRSAVAWCPVHENLDRISEDNYPWDANGVPKPAAAFNLERGGFLAPTGTLPPDLGLRRLARAADAIVDRDAFLKMALGRGAHRGSLAQEHREASERMRSARNHALEVITQRANDTIAEAWDEFLRQQHRDLVAMCVRDVFEIVDASAVVAQWGELASQTCVRGAWTGVGCMESVTGLVNKFTRAARAGSEMEIWCPLRSDDFTIVGTFRPDATFDCEGRLEILGWVVSTIGSKMEKALAYCPAEKRKVEHNYGGCVTMVVSVATFVGASALSFSTGAQFDCNNMTATDVALALRFIAGEEDAFEEFVNSHHTRGLHCVRDMISGVRTLGIASMQASKATQFCGELPDSTCGKNIASSMTAFIAAAESAVLAAAECQLKPYADEKDVKRVKTLCTAYSASWVKEMSVTAALAVEAADSCRMSSTAAGECAASVSKALAAFAYMLEGAALAGRSCPFDQVRTGDTAYACGSTLELHGEAILVASAAIGAATMNCGLGLQRAKTPPVGLNRRFWVPR